MENKSWIDRCPWWVALLFWTVGVIALINFLAFAAHEEKLKLQKERDQLLQIGPRNGR